jgi:beta-lactamase class A
VVRISDAAEVALRAEEAWLAASVIKVPIGLEFYAEADEGRLDEKEAVILEPSGRTPGPIGISLAIDPVTMSLRDLCTAMLTISDNAATDVVLERVTTEAVNRRLRHLGCGATVLVASIHESIDAMAGDLGFADYATLLRAQAGELGAEAQAASTDQNRIGSSRVLDPERASCTTARDMTRLVTAIWSDEGASPGACAELRRTMAQQLTRRLAVAVPPGGSLAARRGAGSLSRWRRMAASPGSLRSVPHATATPTRK